MMNDLERLLEASIKMAKQDNLIKLLRHENGLLKLKVDMQRDAIANLHARLYNDFDMAADTPALLRRQAD